MIKRDIKITIKIKTKQKKIESTFTGKVSTFLLVYVPPPHLSSSINSQAQEIIEIRKKISKEGDNLRMEPLESLVAEIFIPNDEHAVIQAKSDNATVELW